MSRAALYARFSSDLQNPRSITDQIALCRAFAERQGHVVVETFSDAALSGASIIGRSGLEALMQAARERRFDVVIVEALDRISRDMADLPTIWRLLAFLNIRLIAVDDGEASELAIGVRGVLGALYLKDLAAKTRRGLMGKLAQGMRAGGLPFGYRPIAGRPGEPEIDEAQAAIVRHIFALYAEGTSPRTIAAILNREGVKPSRGRAWNASTLHGSAKRASGMLANAIYRGEIVWNRVSKLRSPHTGKKLPRINAPDTWKRVEAPHLRIVDEVTWCKVQVMLAERRQAPRVMFTAPQRLLSGLLRCASCGSGIVSAGSRDGRPIAACSRVRESGDCDNRRRYPLDVIESRVLDALRDELRRPEVTQAATDAFCDEWAKLAKDRRRQRGSATKRLQNVERELRALVDALAKEKVTIEAIRDRLYALEAERATLRQTIAEAEAANVVELHPEAIGLYLRAVERLRETLSEPGALPERKLLRDLIDHIEVEPLGADGKVRFEIRGRLNVLTAKPREAGASRSLVPRGGIEPPTP
jgi:site-specific DNA recombinase